MAVFKQRKVDATTIQTTRVRQYKDSTEGYNVVRLLDINGNIIPFGNLVPLNSSTYFTWNLWADFDHYYHGTKRVLLGA